MYDHNSDEVFIFPVFWVFHPPHLTDPRQLYHTAPSSWPLQFPWTYHEFHPSSPRIRTQVRLPAVEPRQSRIGPFVTRQTVCTRRGMCYLQVHDEEWEPGVPIINRPDIGDKPITDLLDGFTEEGWCKRFGGSRCSASDGRHIFAGNEYYLVADRVVFDTPHPWLGILDICFHALEKIVNNLADILLAGEWKKLYARKWNFETVHLQESLLCIWLVYDLPSTLLCWEKFIFRTLPILTLSTPQLAGWMICTYPKAQLECGTILSQFFFKLSLNSGNNRGWAFRTERCPIPSMSSFNFYLNANSRKCIVSHPFWPTDIFYTQHGWWQREGIIELCNRPWPVRQWSQSSGGPVPLWCCVLLF